jgi:hypothetical protein
VVDWYNGGINVEYSVRVQIDTTLVNNCGHSTNSGGEYPIHLESAATETYVVNSITRLCGKSMTGKTGGGNVIAYGYFDDTMYDAFNGSTADYFMDNAANGAHFAGTHNDLFEGNWSDNLDGDDTHGNAVYHTFFRNWGTGLRTAFTDPSNGKTVDDFNGIGWTCPSSPTTCTANAPGPLRAAGPMMHHYWYAFVGNVLGSASKTTTANGWSYQGSEAVPKAIWFSGWNNDASNPTKTDPNLTSFSFMFRSGNYDYVTGTINDWATGYSQTLPNSLYLTSKPAFFTGATCTYPWPWVTSQSSPYIQTNSCGGSGLPAQARWNAGTPFVQP